MEPGSKRKLQQVGPNPNEDDLLLLDWPPVCLFENGDWCIANPKEMPLTPAAVIDLPMDFVDKYDVLNALECDLVPLIPL